MYDLSSFRNPRYTKEMMYFLLPHHLFLTPFVSAIFHHLQHPYLALNSISSDIFNEEISRQQSIRVDRARIETNR